MLRRFQVTKVLTLLISLSFLLASFIPVGFMPGKNFGKITICSGNGFKEISIPTDFAPHKKSDQKPCSFAVLAAYTSSDIPVFDFDVTKLIETKAFVLGLKSVTAVQAKSYLSQGPPVLSVA